MTGDLDLTARMRMRALHHQAHDAPFMDAKPKDVLALLDLLDHERDRAQHAEIQTGVMTERAEAAEARAEAAVSSLAREIATTSTRTYEHTRGSVDILVQLLAEAQIRGAFARAEAAEATVARLETFVAEMIDPQGQGSVVAARVAEQLRAVLDGES